MLRENYLNLNSDFKNFVKNKIFEHLNNVSYSSGYNKKQNCYDLFLFIKNNIFFIKTHFGISFINVVKNKIKNLRNSPECDEEKLINILNEVDLLLS